MKLPFDLFCSPFERGLSHSSLNYHAINQSRNLNDARTKIAINATNGNTVIRDTFFEIPDDSVTLSVGMLWNSTDHKWRYAVAPNIIISNSYYSNIKGLFTSSTITLAEPDGRVVSYYKSGEEYLSSEPDERGISRLKWDEKTKTTTRTFPDNGEQEVFDEKGLLIKKISPTGKITTYQHGESGDVCNITLPSKREIQLIPETNDLNIKNLVLKTSDGILKLANYKFENDNLTTTIPNTAITNYKYNSVNSLANLEITSSDETKFQLTFAAKGKIKNIVEGNNESIWQANLNGNSFNISSDTNAYIVGFDATKHLSSYQLPTGDKKTFICNANTGQLNRIIEPDVIRNLTYDIKTGLINTQASTDDTNSQEFVYNSEPGSQFGIKLAEVQKDRNVFAVRFFVYEANSRLPKYEISPEGRVIQYSYNNANQLIAVKQTTEFYNINQLSLEKKNYPDITKLNEWWSKQATKQISLTNIGYDKCGRTNSTITYTSLKENGEGIIDDACQRKEQTLGEFGLIRREEISVSSDIKRVTQKEYDLLSRILSKKEGVENSRTSSVVYQSNQTVTTAPSGLVSTTTKNKRGLVASIKRNDRESELFYNKDGSIKEVNREAGQKEHNVCDAQGRLQYKVLPDGSFYKIEYDSRGVLSCNYKYKIKLPKPIESAKLKNRIENAIASDSTSLASYEIFNSQGELRFEIVLQPDPADSILKAKISEHSYQLGKRIETLQYAKAITAADLGVINYQSLIKNSKLDKNDLSNRIKRFFYDKDGLQIGEQTLSHINKIERLGFTRQYERDGLGNITKEIIYLNKSTLSNNLQDAIPQDKTSLTTRYLYNNAGKRIAALDPDNYLTTYAYYGNGKPKEEVSYKNKITDFTPPFPTPTEQDKIITYTYDDLDRLDTITNSQTHLKIKSYYDKDDNEIKTVLTDLLTGESKNTRKEFNVYGELIAQAGFRVCAAMTKDNDKAHWSFNTIHPETQLILNQSDPLGNKTYFFYNENRQPEYVVKADGSVTYVEYDPICNKPIYTYQFYNRINVQQLLESLADYDGFDHQSAFEAILKIDLQHDRNNQKKYTAEGVLIAEKDSLGAEHRYVHNNFGELSEEAHQIDENQTLTVKHEHDLRSNTTKTTKDPGNLKVVNEQAFDDPLNRPTQAIKESGLQITIKHQGLRSQTQKINDGETTASKTSTVDAYLRPETETNWNSAEPTRHEYDDAKRQHIEVNPVESERNTIETHDAFGNLRSHTQNNRTTIFTPGVDGQTEKTELPNHAVATNAYDIDGALHEVTDASKKLTVLARNNVGQLLSKNDGHLSTTYKPDVFGNNAEIINPLGLLKKIESIGTAKAITTDPDNLNLQENQTFNYASGLTKILQGSGNETYQENINRDVLNREIERVVALEGNETLTLKASKWDAAGNLIEEKDGNGNCQRKVYDKRGNLRFAIDAEGFVIEKQYDADRNEIIERCYKAQLNEDELKQLNTQTTPTDIQKLLNNRAFTLRQFIRDADGLLRYELNFIENANPSKVAIIEHKYNGSKECIQTIAHSNVYTTLDPNEVPSLASIIEKLIGNPNNRITDISRNSIGKRSLRRDPEGYVVEKRYDAKGKPIARIHYAAQFKELDFTQDNDAIKQNLQSSSEDRADYFIYDIHGNLRFEIDGEGFVIEHRYDATHNETDRIHYATKLSQAKGIDRVSLYSTLANESRDTNETINLFESVITSIQSPENDVWEKDVFDKAGRHEQSGFKGFNLEKYTLNALGLKKQRTDKRGNIWDIQYDKAKRPVKEISPEITITQHSQSANNSPVESQTLSTRLEVATGYDAASNQTSHTAAANVKSQQRQIEKRYDKNNQFIGTIIRAVKVDKDKDLNLDPSIRPEVVDDITTEIHLDFAGREVLTINEDESKIFTVYDDYGRKRFIIDAGGCITEFQYDDAFFEPTRTIRYDVRIEENELAQRQTPYALEEIIQRVTKTASVDRTLSHTYDHRGLPFSTTKDSIINAKSEDDGEVKILSNAAPETIYQHNAFGECTRQEELIDGDGNKVVTVYGHDKNGNQDLIITPKGYVTQFEYGIKNIDPKKRGSVLLEKTEWHNPLNQDWEKSPVDKNNLNLVASDFDRHYQYKYDTRLLPIKEISWNGKCFYATQINAHGKVEPSPTDNKVEISTQYDQEGDPAKYTNALGDERHLLRNACGDVIGETAFPNQLDINNTTKHIAYTKHLIDAHHQSNGSIQFANSATIDAASQKPIEPTASPQDAHTKIVTDNRGNHIVTQKPSGQLLYKTFNATGKLVRQYSWETGYRLENGKPTRKKHLRALRFRYNKKHQLSMHAIADENQEVQTHKFFNSFDECIGEGPTADKRILMREFNQAGYCYYNNIEQAKPTLTLHNLRGDEIAHYRSGILNLALYRNDLEKGILDLLGKPYSSTYKAIQRTVLQMDKEGGVLKQHTPWFRRKPKDLPSVIQMAFTILKINNQTYITWTDNGILGLTGEFNLCKKGTSSWKKLNEETIQDPNQPEKILHAVNISDIDSGFYDYRLNLFHQDPETKKLSRSPSFTAVGETLLDTGKNGLDKVLWYMRDEKTLVLKGKIEDITGIELIKPNKPSKRIAAYKNQDAELIVDLSEEESGDFDFKTLHGSEVLSADYHSYFYQPTFNFAIPPTSMTATGLPEGVTLGVNIVPAIAALPAMRCRFKENHCDEIRPAAAPLPGAVCRAIDASGGHFYLDTFLGDFRNADNLQPMNSWNHDPYYTGGYLQLVPCIGTPFYLIPKNNDKQVHALQLADKNYPVKPWANGNSILPGIPYNQTVRIRSVSLDAAPASDVKGNIKVRTKKSSSLFTPREISITGLNIKNYKAGGVLYSHFHDTVRNYYFYDWKTNLDKPNHLICTVNGVTNDIMKLENIPFAPDNTPTHFQQMMPQVPGPSAGMLTLSIVNEAGHIIPLGNINADKVTGFSKPRINLIHVDRYIDFEAQLIDQSVYPDIHTLYFSPLPPNVSQVVFEVFTKDNIWSSREAKIGSKGFSISLTTLEPGSYSFRVKLLDAAKNIIPIPEQDVETDDEGFYYSEMTVTKAAPGLETFVSKTEEQITEVAKPVGEIAHDRYGNILSETNHSGATTTNTFSLFNSLATTTSPEVANCDEHGVTIRQALTTQFLENKLGQPLGKVDADGDKDLQVVNSAGKILRHTDADLVNQTHIYDGFDRTLSSQLGNSKPVTSSFSTNEELEIEKRTDGMGNEETFERNEVRNCISQTSLGVTSYSDYNLQNKETVHINPSLHTRETEYDLRTGNKTKYKDEDGNRQYWNREPDDDDKHNVPVKLPTDEQAYVGIPVSHVDLSGQAINNTHNFNQQVIAEKGEVNAEINAKRGKSEIIGPNGDEGNPPPARDIRYLLTEAGQVSDILDEGAHLRTHKSFDLDGYCEAYFFIASDGRVYQATNTDYDELHRIRSICDTRIMLKMGYDKKNNRRYAKAYALNDDSSFCLKESWATYSAASRPLLRDCLLDDGVIKMMEDQGMEMIFSEDLLSRIRQQKKNQQTQCQDLGYHDNKQLRDSRTTDEATGELLSAMHVQPPTAPVRSYATTQDKYCQVFVDQTQPKPYEWSKFEVPTFVFSMQDQRLFYYADNTSGGSEIEYKKDDKLKHITSGNEREIKAALRKYYETRYGVHSTHVTHLDQDSFVSSEETTSKRQQSTRVVKKQTGTGLPIDEETRIHLELPDKETHADILDLTHSEYRKGDAPEINRVTTDRSVQSNGDVGAYPPKAQTYATADANGTTVGIQGALPVMGNERPESFRQFIINSENCVVYKQNASNGRNYYFYAEKQPGKTVLIGYFGDIPEAMLLRAFALSEDREPPAVFNIDTNSTAISPSYPPPLPASYTPNGNMDYEQIANELNYTGYGAAIANANGASINDKPTQTIKIPPIVMAIADTAWNGAIPPLDRVLGSMTPYIPVPCITPKPKEVNFFEEFIEVAACIAIMGAAPEVFLGMMGTTLGAASPLALMIAGGASGALAGAIDQTIAMGFGSQKSFNVKSLAIQTLTSAISAGIGGPNISSFDIGSVVHRVVNAEVIAAAQQAALVASHLQKSVNWQSFARAGLNGVINGANDRLMQNQPTWLSAGTANFANKLGDAAMYHQRLNNNDLAATTVGTMLGTKLGSMHFQKAMADTKKTAALEAVAHRGAMSATANVGRPTPPPRGPNGSPGNPFDGARSSASANSKPKGPTLFGGAKAKSWSSYKAEKAKVSNWQKELEHERQWGQVNEVIGNVTGMDFEDAAKVIGFDHMSHVVPSIIASEFPLPAPSISDYVNASGRGLRGTWDSIETGVLHPLNSIGNTLQMSWDGYNAYADLVFGISTQGSRERNLARGIGINNAIDRVVNGNGVTRTEVATQVVSTVVASVLMGKVVGNVVSGIKGISTRGLFGGESVAKGHVFEEAEPFFPSGTVGSARAWTNKARLKTADLPIEGRIRYVPPKGYNASEPLPRGPNNGYLDRFNNEWVKGPSRTIGQPFEWDVQLSSQGRNQLGWASRGGNHVNVSLDGKFTHR